MKLFICFRKNLSLRHQKNSFPCTKHIECEMDWRIKLEVFKKIAAELRTENITQTYFVESYLNKKEFLSFSYIQYLYLSRILYVKHWRNSVHNVYGSRFQTLGGSRVPLLNFEGGSGSQVPRSPKSYHAIFCKIMPYFVNISFLRAFTV